MNTRSLIRTKATVLAIAFVIISLISALAASTAIGAYANFPDWYYTSDFGANTIDVDNSQFNSGSQALANPDGWSGSPLHNLNPNTQHMRLGIIELTNTAFASSREDLALDHYFGSSEYPRTPLGEIEHPDTNKNALLINTNGINTAYGFSSSEFQLDAHSFFHISVWVRTGNFAANSGAAITLTGMRDSLSFVNINTFDGNQTNSGNFNWQEFNFFIQTDFVANQMVLNLSVGQGSIDDNDIRFNPANGWAMFSNVIVRQLSPTRFDDITSSFNQNNTFSLPNNNPNVTIHNNTVSVTGSRGGLTVFKYSPRVHAVLTYDNLNPDLSIKQDAYVAPLFVDNSDTINTSWTALGSPNMHIINARTADSSNPHQLTTNPRSPDLTDNSNVLLMSTFNRQSQPSSFFNAALSLQYENLTILRHQYYRFSVWVRTMNMNGQGIGAYIHISGESTRFDDNFELNVWDRNIDASVGNPINHNWVERAFYIQGSAIRDRQIRITLGLGHNDEGLSGGNVLWANPTMRSIVASQFASGGGTQVTFDSQSESDNGISNGNFDIAGDFDNFAYPLVAQDWQFVTPSSPGMSGWSNSTVNAQNAIHGIVPTELEHFDNNRHLYGNIPRPNLPFPAPHNLMLMQSSTDTAFGFRSNIITVEADSNTVVQVSMMTALNGQGANIVLRQGDRILRSIQGIHTNNQWQTFSLFVQASNQSLEVSLEIWFGFGDNFVNENNLSSGHIFVNSASTVELAQGIAAHNIDAGNFDDLLQHYTQQLQRGLHPSYTVYTASVDSFITFDRYNNDLVRPLHDWTVSSQGSGANIANRTVFGAFNVLQALGNNVTGGSTIIPTNWIPNPSGTGFIQQHTRPHFRHSSDDNPFVLTLQHTSPTASRITSSLSYPTQANSFYRMSISLRANLDNLTADSIGLGIELVGTQFAFRDIRDTRDIVYKDNDALRRGWWNDQYQEFVFYISTADQTPELSLAITLGGIGHSREHAIGSVFINNISFETMAVSDFQAAIEDIDNYDYFEHRLEKRLFANVGNVVIDPEVTPSGAEVNWILVASILFAIALVIVLIGLFLRASTNRLSKKATDLQPKPQKAAYDRNVAQQTTIASVATPTVSIPTLQDVYDQFDESQPVSTQRRPKHNERIEYKEVEITEEIEVQVADENYQQQDGAIITQVDEYGVQQDTVQPKTVKQTVIRKVLQPTVVKRVDEYKDEFED